VTDDLLAIAARAAGSARDGEQVEAYVVRTRETDVAVFGGEVESLSVAGVEGVGIRVVTGGRLGYAWAGSLDDDAVRETIDEARDNAVFSQPDEWVALASPSDVAAVDPPVLDLWSDDLATLDTDTKVRLALDVEAATKGADRRIRGVESAGYGDALLEHAVASSLGVAAAVRRTVCSAHAFAMAADGDETHTGYGTAAARSLADLDLEGVPRDAATRACRLLGATKPPTRRLPVVLDALVTQSLLGVLGAALDGEAVLKGRSMFCDRVGEQVAAPSVHLVDDPTDPRALGAATHDAEGVPTRRNVLVADGVLRGFLHNVSTGRRAGTSTTGSAVRAGFTSTPGVGPRALRFEPGEKTAEAILASVPDGLYVQAVTGLHSGTNPVSGDFSVGAEGLLVRDGALGAPVREVTVASTLQRMLLDVVEVGADLRFLPGSAAGVTLLLAEMTMAGA
jgi:PmbA protein